MNHTAQRGSLISVRPSFFFIGVWDAGHWDKADHLYGREKKKISEK